MTLTLTNHNCLYCLDRKIQAKLVSPLIPLSYPLPHLAPHVPVGAVVALSDPLHYLGNLEPSVAYSQGRDQILSVEAME